MSLASKRMPRPSRIHIILYVKDQKKSRDFYSALLNMQAGLDVPGMTEFEIQKNCVLGLMPEKGIKRLLGDKLPDPESANGIPRAELYLLVEDPKELANRALELGAKELSPLSPRDWGHDVAYFLDADGHVLAFARPTPTR
jgi:catechol 2,3-dioxygenase-like lactoylglutathione lyase family enzyme